MTNDPQALLRYPTRRQFLKKTTSAAIAGMALSGCGWTLAQVRPKISSEGSSKVLYIFTWSSYTDREMLDQFERETGIKVVADVFESNEAMLARLQAGGSGGYSIIYPSDYMVAQMMELGLLRQLDRSRLIGLKQLVPRFRNPVYDPGNQYSVPLSWGTTGLIYNTQKLKSAPQDWNYLWQNQRRLSGRMTLLNDVREVMGAALKMLGHSYNSKNPREIQQAYEKLAQLKPNLASFTSDAWREQIKSGDLMLAMCYSADANEVIEESSNLKYVVPKSGSSFWTDTLAIPITAPNVDGAYAWINFMLKPNIAAQIAERLSFAIPNKAGIDKLPAKVKNNQNLFPPEYVLKRCESIAPVGKVSEVYDSYWTKLASS